MLLKYDIYINDQVIQKRLQVLVNQIYKLLPNREEGHDWEKPLETILEELAGMQRLIKQSDSSELFFPLLNKLEGLYSLNQEKDFLCYRRTIFECLSLMNELQKKLCHQNY